MTTDELIAMAREADPFGDDGRLVSLAMLTPETLARFAALVAAREREACAQSQEPGARGLVNVAWLHGGARARPRCPKSD